MSTRYNGFAAGKPFRRTRLVEGGCLRVQLHVSRIDAGAENPGIIEIAFSSLDQQNFEIVIQIGQPVIVRTTVYDANSVNDLPARDYTSTTSTSCHNDIKLLRQRTAIS